VCWYRPITHQTIQASNKVDLKSKLILFFAILNVPALLQSKAFCPYSQAEKTATILTSDPEIKTTKPICLKTVFYIVQSMSHTDAALLVKVFTSNHYLDQTINASDSKLNFDYFKIKTSCC
jgi:hypothetical protein